MSTLRVTSGPAAGTALVVQEEIVIGRENVDLTIADGELSRRHAVVRPEGQGVVVEDLGSMNGTFVDGWRITEPVTLSGTATIRVGKSEISLELSAAAPTRAAPIVEGQQATRASDVPVMDVDDATRVRDVPVVDIDNATRARDVPVVDTPRATRASDVPVAKAPQATRASDVPVAEVSQPTRTSPAVPPQGGGAAGGRPPAAIAGIPTIVVAGVAVALVVVLLILLLG
ncbi:MAG: FHA domain-containing protein [Solirubrobacterales bacterium]